VAELESENSELRITSDQKLAEEKRKLIEEVEEIRRRE
jgi:hypothetical protein